MISALLRRGACGPSDIRACDIDTARLAVIEKTYEVGCGVEVEKAIRDCDVVVLSVKPQVLSGVLSELKRALQPSQLVLSIVAGAKLDTIRRGLAHDAIVRVMPNTPAQVGQGMSVWTATDSVTAKQREAVQTILQSMGREINVPDEKYIDMATAISGSGPAYLFLILEALTDAGVHIGLPRDTAQELAVQTMVGAGHVAQETGRHPAELKNAVTSPGGTTAEALLQLEDGGIRAIISQAVIAAYEKAQELGGQSSK
jgi:pyrroline-5-carboxylate reductase